MNVRMQREWFWIVLEIIRLVCSTRRKKWILCTQLSTGMTTRFIAESALVTGEVQYIENKENWVEELIALVEENHRVFMIEGYGLIILADTGLQVYFWKIHAHI